MAEIPRPRWSRQDLTEGCAPECPHCRAPMDKAPMTLEALAVGWPALGGFVFCDRDGYAASDSPFPAAHCPACAKPSIVTFTETEMRLFAQRTAADERWLAGEGKP